MKKSKHNYDLPTGFTPAQFITVACIIIGVIILIFVFLGKKSPKMYTEGTFPKLSYKCLTTSPGGPPVKVIVSKPRKAPLYEKADITTSSGNSVLFFEILYVYQKENNFYQVGIEPFSGKTIGWVEKPDVLEWSNHSALRVMQNLGRAPIYIWEQKEDIGRDNWKYKQRTNGQPFVPFPIFEMAGNHYRIAFICRMETGEPVIGQGWTSAVNVPDDAGIVCFITQDELKAHMLRHLHIIKQLKNEPYFDHPIIRLFQEKLGITFGHHKDIWIEITAFIKEITGDSAKLAAVLDKIPANSRSVFRKKIYSFKEMETFYENIYNWDKDRRGWIPEHLREGTAHEQH